MGASQKGTKLFIRVSAKVKPAGGHRSGEAWRSTERKPDEPTGIRGRDWSIIIQI